MHTSPTIRKIFEGVADAPRDVPHVRPPSRRPGHGRGRRRHLFAGEWFEIAEAEHDYMLEILPPLWMRGDMFAMREFITGSVTSVFFALTIDGRRASSTAIATLPDRGSPERMSTAIVERESRPVRAMTREERARAYLVRTHDDYRGYAGERWPPLCGQAHLWSTAETRHRAEAARRSHR